MELKENCIYSTQNIKDFFGVTDSKWKKQKNKLLLHLSNYYEYEVVYDESDHRKINYKIIKILADYEPYITDKKKDMTKRDNLFEHEIIDVIEGDNLQTAKNISRIIDSTIKEHFNYTTDTIYEYTRLRVNEWFGKGNHEHGTKGMITDKVWCYLDIDNNFYVPLSDSEIERFYNLYGIEKAEINKLELELMYDYENGLITKEELNESIGNNSYICFTSAKKRFKEIYGYYPIKVPCYAIGVFSDSAFDNVESENFDF